jgi:type IV pilus assembly protein PilA
MSADAVATAHNRGFTLIELMIVVVIVGILATLAVVGYRKIVNTSHVSEALTMVQNIRVAEEAYYSETQQYASLSAAIPTTLTGWYPQNPVYQTMTGWGGTCSSGCGAVAWSVLPLHVDGPVLFGYAAIANSAVTAPASLSPFNGSTLPITAPATDWYIVGAAADLDGTTSNWTNVYAVSWSNQVFVSNEGL